MHDKSLTTLRGLAQSLDIPNVFQLDKSHLIQAIEAKQRATMPELVVDIPKPQYDARLMTKPPAKLSDVDMVQDYLKEHVARGLRLTFDEEHWYMSFGQKTDEGTLRMPPRVVIGCADKVMK